MRRGSPPAYRTAVRDGGERTARRVTTASPAEAGLASARGGANLEQRHTRQRQRDLQRQLSVAHRIAQRPASYGLHWVGLGSYAKLFSAPSGTSARGVNASSTSGRCPARVTAS